MPVGDAVVRLIIFLTGLIVKTHVFTLSRLMGYRHYVPDNPGEIVDVQGKVLGRHDGLHLYTLGQRKGHGVASPREGMAYVVVGKDLTQNRLVVGWDVQDTPGLYTNRCRVGTLNWINEPILTPRRIEAQPRYRAKAEPITLEPTGPNQVRVEFRTPQRALVPGQICAFYDGGRLLGGGVFESVGMGD
jgi:tRNA-specific 2-thiouridylase